MQQHIFLKKHPTRNASSNKRKEKKKATKNASNK
jgi:hypothetical protein